MFDVGFWEITIIAVVALLVVGPERLPGLVKTAGHWLGRAQRITRDLRRELENEAEFQEIKNLKRDMSLNDLKDHRGEFGRTLDGGYPGENKQSTFIDDSELDHDQPEKN